MDTSETEISPSSTDWTPASCTLPTTERPLRMAEFDQLFASAVREVRRIDATSLDLLLPASERERAADLAARETDCCTFFQFAIHDEGHDRCRLSVTVPPAHVDVLDALAARYV